MRYEEIALPVEGSMEGAKLQLYILNESPEIVRENKRKTIVLCPGGGYQSTSDREAEALAMKFLANGHHVAVLRYSIAPVRYPVALQELAWTMKYLREHSEESSLDPEKIVVQGSSAGGHLAASFATFYEKEVVWKAVDGSPEMIRPNGLMLSYPVITSGPYAHHDSIKNLLGARYDELKEEMSLEKRVHDKMPSTFIWHTFTDEVVPMENSMFFVQALKEKNVPTEFHLFANGAHGLGLANELTKGHNDNTLQPEVEVWIDLALAYMERL